MFHRARESISAKGSIRAKSSDSSASGPEPNGHPHPLLNGDAKANGVPATVEVDNTNAEGKTAAQRQQEESHVPPGHELKRPSTETRKRQLSFTEEKVQRAEERRKHDEQEENERRERRRRLHEEVSFHDSRYSDGRSKSEHHTSQDPLRDNYGDLPLNMSQMEERVYSSTE